MEKENTAIRLKKIMKQRELRQIDILNLTRPLCKQYNVKMNKSDISQYCSGKTEPNQEKLFILGSALNVNEAWLMGFDVPMERHNVKASAEITVYKIHCETENESKLILSYRELNNANQSRVRAYTENLLSAQKMEEELATATRYQQPTTLAAHHEGNEYTEDELKEIDQFKKMVENKRK